MVAHDPLHRSQRTEGALRLAEGSRRGVGLPRVGVAARKVERENRAFELGVLGIAHPSEVRIPRRRGAPHEDNSVL